MRRAGGARAVGLVRHFVALALSSLLVLAIDTEVAASRPIQGPHPDAAPGLHHEGQPRGEQCHAACPTGADLRTRHLLSSVSFTGAAITSVPAAGTAYSEGEEIEVTLTSSEFVSVSGAASVTLVVGAVLRAASLVPTSGATTKLRFRYAVAADDLDEDGISLDADSFALADGSAMANLLGQPVDASSPTHEGISPNAAHCVAPAHGVNIIVITSRPEGGWYGVGDRINIIVSVPRGVVLPVPQDVGQVPTMTIEVGNPGATASRVLLMDEPVSEEYFLVFRYVVAENDYDSDGLFFPGSCISAVPGALMDPYGRDIGLGNSATGPLLHHAVDGVRPTVSSPPIIAVAPPAVWGEPYAVSVTFSLSEAVTAVEGSPTLVISLKDASDAVATVTATLDVTATTSEALVLAAALEHPAPGAYTLEVVENSLAIAGASIVDVAGNAMTDASHAGTDITLSVPQPELRVSGVSLASSPRPEAAGWYAIRDSILIEVSCSVVVELDLSAGSPTVSLSVGGRAEPAALESGAGTAVLTFRYDVREGDLEEGGVAVVADSLGLNGAVVTNATVKSLAHAAVASEHRVDGVAPTVLSGPIITEIAAATNFGIGAAVEITVDFSEAVSVAGSLSLSLSLGAAPRLAVLQRLTEGGRVAVFQYTVTESDPSGATVAVAEGSMALEEGGAVRDRAGNALVFPIGHPGASGGRVDTVRPTILAVVGITGPSGSAFAAGELISVRISASESLRVTETPSLTLTLGSAERTAPLTHASGSSLVFTYQVADGDSAPDGVSLSPDSARISGGTVTDLAGNPLNLALPPSGPPDLPPIDTSGPSIAGVTLQQRQDGGPFRMGDSIVATVAFSTAVELPPTAVLWLGIGDGAVPATLVGGNGTAEAKFRYAVAVGEYDIDGIDVRGLSGNEADGAPTSAAAVLLPSGAALATKNASKSFEMTFVDAVPPSVTVAAFTGVLGGSTANLTRVPELVSVQLTLSERVSVSGGGVPSVSVRIGGATYMAYADPSALLAGALSSLTFSYRVVSEPDFAAAEVSLLPDSLRLGGLTVSDWAGNALALSNPSLTVRIGAAAPAVPPAETPASAAAPEPPSEDDAPGPASEDGTDGADETDGADGVDDNASEGPADGSTPDVDPGSGEEEDPGVQDGEDDGGGSNDGSVGEGGGVDGEGSGDGAVNDPGEVGDGVVADGGSGEGKENDVDDGASGESGGNAEGDVVAGGNAAAQPFLLRIAYNMSIDVGASGQVPWGELEARARSATAWQFGVPEERVIVRLDSAQRRALLQAQTVSYEAIVAFPSKEEADGVATIFQSASLTDLEASFIGSGIPIVPNSIDRSTLVLQVEDVTPPEPVQDEAPEGAAQLEPGEVEEADGVPSGGSAGGVPLWSLYAMPGAVLLATCAGVFVIMRKRRALALSSKATSRTTSELSASSRTGSFDDLEGAQGGDGDSEMGWTLFGTAFGGEGGRTLFASGLERMTHFFRLGRSGERAASDGQDED